MTCGCASETHHSRIRSSTIEKWGSFRLPYLNAATFRDTAGQLGRADQRVLGIGIEVLAVAEHEGASSLQGTMAQVRKGEPPTKRCMTKKAAMRSKATRRIRQRHSPSRRRWRMRRR